MECRMEVSRACVRVCVRARVRACVRVCMRAFVRLCTRACAHNCEASGFRGSFPHRRVTENTGIEYYVSPSFEADMDRFHGACVQEQRATWNEHAAMHAAAIVRARPICTASTARLCVCLRLNLALVDCARAILAAHVRRTCGARVRACARP